MIIVYASDERMGTELGKKMIEKGYLNTFLLSGGIEKFLEEFGELVEGIDVPEPVKKVKDEKEKQKI
jgi:centrosomal protein CEP41